MANDLTRQQTEAMMEFKGKFANFICPWKPKTMARLEAMGLTEPVLFSGKVMGYRITNLGRERLSTIIGGGDAPQEGG